MRNLKLYIFRYFLVKRMAAIATMISMTASFSHYQGFRLLDILADYSLYLQSLERKIHEQRAAKPTQGVSDGTQNS